MVLEKMGQIHAKKKVKLDHFFIPYARIKSKWINNLNVRLKIMKLLEENLHSKICDVSLRNIFSDIFPQTRETNKQK